MMCSNDFKITDDRAIGLKSLRQEILMDFSTGIMVASLKHYGTVHWCKKVLKIEVLKTGAS